MKVLLVLPLKQVGLQVHLTPKLQEKSTWQKEMRQKVTLYEEFKRWRELKSELEVMTDKEIASFLLDKHYYGRRKEKR